VNQSGTSVNANLDWCVGKHFIGKNHKTKKEEKGEKKASEFSLTEDGGESKSLNKKVERESWGAGG